MKLELWQQRVVLGQIILKTLTACQSQPELAQFSKWRHGALTAGLSNWLAGRQLDDSLMTAGDSWVRPVAWCLTAAVVLEQWSQWLAGVSARHWSSLVAGQAGGGCLVSTLHVCLAADSSHYTESALHLPALSLSPLIYSLQKYFLSCFHHVRLCCIIV